MTASYPVGITRMQGETLALSTTLASLGIPPGFHQAVLHAPGKAFRLHMNPAVLDVAYYDASQPAGSRYVRAGSSGAGMLRSDLSDRSTATSTGSILDSGQTTDYLYVCAWDAIGGLRLTVGNANANAAALVVEYRKSDDTWAALSITDGTDSGGATLAQSGSVTWTVPTDWKVAQLGGPQGIVSDAGAPSTNGYWLRLSWDAALDSSTSITELWTLNKDASRGYYRAGQEYTVSIDRRAVGAIEAVLAADTDTLQVTWVRTVQ